MLYFLAHDAATFHCLARPFAASWRDHSFAPITALAAQLQSTFAAFADRFRLTADESPVLTRVTADQAFNPRLWRHLAGEVLLYAAVECPAIQTAAETLMALVASNQLAAIRQAHTGSRDLDFDGVPYRPGRAGLNAAADVARLTDALRDIDPTGWAETALADADEPAEELAFARDCFAALRALYDQARQHGQIVICEEI